MKAAPNGPVFDPRRLSIEDLQDPERVEEALAHWDELEPALLTAIETHPQHGPRLSMLRRADRWLETKGAELRPAGACPNAEELYDFGRGPGFGPLSGTRRWEIERHLKRCAECEVLVESLSSLPPVPLEVSMRPSGSRRPRLLRRLAPLAAAAALVVALGLWFTFIPSPTTHVGFPQPPLLRGSSGGSLQFPRDRVLHVEPAVRAAFPALDRTILFEIEPRSEATSYRVDVARHGGDPFAADEASLMKLSSSTPAMQATSELATGAYTWTATAVVRGLDQMLGSRDFTVVDDVETSAQLARLASLPEPDRSLEAVNLLHEHGFVTEARAIARAMPPSPGRDAYLSQVPGR